MRFLAIPAIDVRAGAVVRLLQGDYAQQTAYGDDPLTLALAYADAGATWLHLVDLNAARDGGYTLFPLLRALRDDGRLQVQTGGGVRRREDVQALLDAGATRVVVGSVAVRDPDAVADWIKQFGADTLVIALDARCDALGVWRLPTHGWTREDGATLDDLLARYAEIGARHILCTDIDRDGMLAGPNIALYRELAARWPRLRFIASGGVRDAADVRDARNAGCAGIVLGRALLEGRLTMPDALRAAAC